MTHTRLFLELGDNGINLNTPNLNIRRGSAISMVNELEMNQIASRLHGYRKSMVSIASSSDSETDDDEPNSRKSGQSIYSTFSQRMGKKKSTTGLNTEYDTADFDITQVEFLV